MLFVSFWGSCILENIISGVLKLVLGFVRFLNESSGIRLEVFLCIYRDEYGVRILGYDLNVVSCFCSVLDSREFI